jgi:hypothetical protein
MQSSGASALAFTLAQKAESVAFVDIWNMYAAPVLESDRDTVAKVVVTTAFSLDAHRRRFRPDVTLLVLRHPVDTFYSLLGRTYANESGLIDEKFAVLEEIFRTGAGFDRIIHYEDFVFSPRTLIDLSNIIGWPIDDRALLFERTDREIRDTNSAAEPELADRLMYGVGQLQLGGLRRNSVRFLEPSPKSAHLPELCPALFDHYTSMRAERGTLWHVPSPALLSCGLEALVQDVKQDRSKPAGYGLRLTNRTSGSRVVDSVLCPPADGRQTVLTLSGLPGRPFNRVRGVAYAEDPRAAGTAARVWIEGARGRCLGEQEFILRHSEMRSIDLEFEPQNSDVNLSLGVSLAGGVDTPTHGEVCFQGLRLEQVIP